MEILAEQKFQRSLVLKNVRGLISQVGETFETPEKVCIMRRTTLVLECGDTNPFSTNFKTQVHLLVN